MSGAAEVEALQRVLSSEHAAVWVLGSLGAATSASATPDIFSRVAASYDAHRVRRDRLAERLLELDAEPVQSQAAYAVPEPIGDPSRVADAAVRVERTSAEAYAFLVASSTGATRRWAAQVLGEVAVSAVGLGAAPEPLPGASDLLPAP